MNIFNYQQKVAMMRILLDIIHADGRIDAREIYYYNQLKDKFEISEDSHKDVDEKNSLMESPGQPYTKPKLVWWTHAETTIPALYFNELTEENIRIYERNAISKRDYIKSIQSNKEINKLIELLDLSMVSVEENERRKELEDYGHYLRNNK